MNKKNQVEGSPLLPAPERPGRLRAAVFVFFAIVLFQENAPFSAAQVKGGYLYTLSNFAGTVPYDWTRISVDRERNETYVLYQNVIRVFNNSGMEIYSFGENLELGQILDLAVDRTGDIILLSFQDGRPVVTRCDFRGTPASRLEIKNLPGSLKFAATRMLYRKGLLYFASLSPMNVFVTDTAGGYKDHFDIASLLQLDGPKRAEAEMIGFDVDDEGSIYFTIPTFFTVYKISPDRKLGLFGKPGSAPGRFGVIAGIVCDSHGNILVVDKLKCAVIVFDEKFNFLTEFGYRGSKPENLIAPDDIAIDGRDRIYVTQGRRRGVSVFALTYP